MTSCSWESNHTEVRRVIFGYFWDSYLVQLTLRGLISPGQPEHPELN